MEHTCELNNVCVYQLHNQVRRLGACVVALASVCSKALLLLIHWLFVFSLFEWVGIVIGPCYALLSGLSLLQLSSHGRIAGCFILSVFLLALFLVFGALCLFLTVLGLGCSV